MNENVFKILRSLYSEGEGCLKLERPTSRRSQITRTTLLNIDKIKTVIDNYPYCSIYEKEA